MKALNLTDAQRTNCVVTYNLNRFEVFCGSMFLTAALTKADLKQQLRDNGIKAVFDSLAQRKYLLA